MRIRFRRSVLVAAIFGITTAGLMGAMASHGAPPDAAQRGVHRLKVVDRKAFHPGIKVQAPRRVRPGGKFTFRLSELDAGSDYTMWLQPAIGSSTWGQGAGPYYRGTADSFGRASIHSRLPRKIKLCPPWSPRHCDKETWRHADRVNVIVVPEKVYSLEGSRRLRWKNCVRSDVSYHRESQVRGISCENAGEIRFGAKRRFCRRHDGCKSANPDPGKVFRGKVLYHGWNCRVLVAWEGYRVTCQKGAKRIYYLAEI